MSRVRFSRALLLLIAGLITGGAGVVPLRAQTPGPALAEVEGLRKAARFEEARARLERWWETERAEASRSDLQFGHWLRGLLTTEGEAARTEFRRLAVEYPGGPWTDGALHRLGLAAALEGKGAEAAEHFRRILSDYPSSAHRDDARRRLDAVSSGGGPPAASPTGDPAPATGSTPEARPEGVVEAAAAGAAAVSASGNWTVQIGAFSTRDRAERRISELASLGERPRLVRVGDSPLLRVRVGSWPDRQSAEAAARSLAARGVEAVVSGDRDRERPPD